MLIPATMRSRDHAHDGRSIEGFHTAMRTLSRRTPPDSRRIVVPTAGALGDSTVPSVAQRRSVLLRTVAAVLATFVLAVATGGVSWVLHLAADAALVGVVMWLRRAALADAEQAREARKARQLHRAHREAAELAAYRARAARRTYAQPEAPRRRAVGD